MEILTQVLSTKSYQYFGTFTGVMKEIILYLKSNQNKQNILDYYSVVGYYICICLKGDELII